VFQVFASPAGRTFLGRELYSPKAWTDDRERCDTAEIPADRGFTTEPEFAMVILARALDAGRPARWVAGDAVYGQHYKLRKALEDRSVFYVPLVPMNLRVIARTGALGSEVRAGDLITALPAIAWRTRTAGAGSKHRPLPDPRTQTGCPRRPRPGRRSPLSHREKLPDHQRQTGPDHYQVRQHTGWYRHITLSMLAHALTPTRSKKGDIQLLALNLPEIRDVLVRLIFTQPPNPEHVTSRSRSRCHINKPQTDITIETADTPHKRDCRITQPLRSTPSPKWGSDVRRAFHRLYEDPKTGEGCRTR
jgi:hypothetical protein